VAAVARCAPVRGRSDRGMCRGGPVAACGGLCRGRRAVGGRCFAACGSGWRGRSGRAALRPIAGLAVAWAVAAH
jgi:hypothetical protein